MRVRTCRVRRRVRLRGTRVASAASQPSLSPPSAPCSARTNGAHMVCVEPSIETCVVWLMFTVRPWPSSRSWTRPASTSQAARQFAACSPAPPRLPSHAFRRRAPPRREVQQHTRGVCCADACVDGPLHPVTDTHPAGVSARVCSAYTHWLARASMSTLLARTIAGGLRCPTFLRPPSSANIVQGCMTAHGATNTRGVFKRQLAAGRGAPR